ncbi:MAG: triacylglycerol lipase [Solirubrobacteraceae bacterium]|nr:triacylglycerol lipase [Solirubrobacteraceae bacterium]
MRPEVNAVSFWRSEPGAVLEYRRLLADPVFAGHGVTDGEGQPILVVPGFLAPDRLMRPMMQWLRRTGHLPSAAHIGVNIACSETTAARLEERLDHLVHSRGQRAAIIGHSRGGTFARVLAVRRPDLVSGIVTIGTPPLDLSGLALAIKAPATALRMLGRIGIPGLFDSGCFDGACCTSFRSDLAGPFPEELPFTALQAKNDGVVDWRKCVDPASEGVPVEASHLGAVVNPAVFREVASALAGVRSADRLR